jgi:hypothetical protein
VVAGFLCGKADTTVVVLNEKIRDPLMFRNCRNADED